MPEDGSLRKLRDRYGDGWFFHRQGNKVYGFPQVDRPTIPFGTSVALKCQENLSMLAAVVGDIIGRRRFGGQVLFRHRGAEFISSTKELISDVAKQMPDLPDIVKLFKAYPRFTLEAKVLELRDGDGGIGLFVTLGSRWRIEAPLHDLLSKGIDLQGMYVVRRYPEKGQRRLVGRISCIDKGTVKLLESFDGTAEIACDDVWLEGNRENFAYCLKHLLKARYLSFETKRREIEDQLLSGPKFQTTIQSIAQSFTNKPPMQLTPDLQCIVGDMISVKNFGGYCTVRAASPVQCCYDAARTQRMEYPWKGIENLVRLVVTPLQENHRRY